MTIKRYYISANTWCISMQMFKETKSPIAIAKSQKLCPICFQSFLCEHGVKSICVLSCSGICMCLFCCFEVCKVFGHNQNISTNADEIVIVPSFYSLFAVGISLDRCSDGICFGGVQSIFYSSVVGDVWINAPKWAPSFALLWFGLTYWSWVTHICVGKLTIIGSDNGLLPDRRQAIHYLNQNWNILNSNLRNKLQWNLKQNSCIFIQENAL